MKKRRSDLPAFEVDETSRTGHHCPKTGWWSVAGDPAATRFIMKGQVLPASCGQPVMWVLGKVAAGRSVRPADVLVSSQ